jgi:hypothetical protein
MKLRGHKMYGCCGKFYYSDTHESTALHWEYRPCGHCNRANTPRGYDACLGHLPCVMNACCGHGETREAYIQFTPWLTVRGRLAIGLSWVMKFLTRH